MKLIFTGLVAVLICSIAFAQSFSYGNSLRISESKVETIQPGRNLQKPLSFDYNFLKSNYKTVLPAIGITSATPYVLFLFSDNNNTWDEGLKMKMKTRTIVSAGLFIPTIATGYLMRGSNGNPNDGLLTVHKLSTVSNLVVLDATVLKKRKTASLSMIESIVAITMNISFVATITTGGLQSVNKTMPGWVHTTHKITPWITVLSSGALLYLLNN